MTSPTLRFVFAVVAVGTLTAAPVRAQLNLAWNNCITEPDQAENMAYACDGSRNGVPFHCVLSFVSPGALTAFVGFEAIIDVYAGSYMNTNPSLPLPDFWRLGTGECRDGNLSFPAPLAGIGSSACINPWVNGQIAGNAQWTSMSNSERLRLAFATDTPHALAANQRYIAGMFNLDTYGDTDTGHGDCPGCCTPVVIAVNQVTLYQVTGTPPQDFYVIDATGERTSVTWQGDVNGNVPGCAPTPTRRSTWGSIKATYR
jgi:hypothetical protein